MSVALQDHLEGANSALWRMKPEARTQLRSQLSTRLIGSHSYALVAEHDRAGVVGMIFGRVAANERYLPSRAGIIDQLFVQELHRRARVGSLLVAELCYHFADEGVEDLSLRYVAGNDEAAGFWAALGFMPRIITVGASRPTVEWQLAQEAEI
jgi:GNAT superfamily N-acetyltransferase